jgi:hypothetical protein
MTCHGDEISECTNGLEISRFISGANNLFLCPLYRRDLSADRVRFRIEFCVPTKFIQTFFSFCKCTNYVPRCSKTFKMMMMMMMMMFWVLTPYRLVGRYRRFVEIYCLHLQGFREFLRNAGMHLRIYTASKPRRTLSSSRP